MEFEVAHRLTGTLERGVRDVLVLYKLSYVWRISSPQQAGECTQRLEFLPCMGDNPSAGYRLAHEWGKPSAIVIALRSQSIDGGRDGGPGVTLEDGKPYTIEWRRTRDGEMIVLLDGKKIMRTTDRTYADAFHGFSMINKGGEFEETQVSIFGTVH